MRELTKKFMIVDMNEINISTAEKPIIGTQALAPCIAFILYQSDQKKAIVGHLSSNCFLTNGAVELMFSRIKGLIDENGLANQSFDLYLIEGAYQSQQRVYSNDIRALSGSLQYEFTFLEALKIIIGKIPNIQIKSVKYGLEEDDYEIVDEQGNPSNSETALLSKRFAFDTKTGQFVTNQVSFGYEYITINNDFRKK